MHSARAHTRLQNAGFRSVMANVEDGAAYMAETGLAAGASQVDAAAVAGTVDIYSHIQQAPLDPILGTKIMFLKDPSPAKINLGIGAYRTDDGKPYVLSCVRKAEQLIFEDKSLDKEYLTQSGHPGFVRLATAVIYGKNNAAWKEERIAAVQSLSGTGSLRIGAEFIAKFFPGRTCYYSTPTWSNHLQILEAARVPGKPYRYWDAAKRRLDIEGMLADIDAAPQGSVMLLHACAHNPTGVDPTAEQWDKIAAVCKKRQHIVYFDSAYQGFATGDLERDAYAIRKFVDLGMPVMTSQSFAKNFGLYSERVGTFSVVCATKARASDVLSQLELIIRANYSNPPAHGALIVHRVLSTPALYDEWLHEMREMSSRIMKMRSLLFEELKRLGTPGDWSHIVSQIGMFSYTGLTVPQAQSIIKDHHVYMLTNGRISMAGVNSKNVLYLAKAIDAVVRAH